MRSQTLEEEALGTLFEAHSNLAEAIRQHDELERMAQDEQELRQVRERSRKETRMDRNVSRLPITLCSPLGAARTSAWRPARFWLEITIARSARTITPSRLGGTA